MAHGKHEETEIEPVTLDRIVHPGQGPDSGVSQAGGQAEVKRSDTVAALPRAPSLEEDDHALPGESAEDARYRLAETLGEGGMGRIHLCRDARVGRDVAMKILHDRYSAQPDAVARFMREARIQGQLEHPSIVPVYDLGRQPDGSICFTMKRVRGKTIEQIIDGYHANEPTIISRYTRRKLLRAFAQACLAVDFAHTRGVLHRDLKPGNIMLGDYGEVYVLDWGLSKVVHAPELTTSEAVDMDELAHTRTVDGAVMGTPGYMSPEQARGQTQRLDPRSDVYSLGAILYEMLALQPLHRRGTVAGMMWSTVSGTDARPSFAAPQRNIPPELDAICVKATQLDPDQRMASARELHDAIERYLDGEEDSKLRKEMAMSHAEAADVAAEYAFAGGANANQERVRALKEVGRALALDPANAMARRIMVRLLAEPPRELPEEERVEVQAQTRGMGRMAAAMGGFFHLAFLISAAFVLWMGVHSWWALGVYIAVSSAATVGSFVTARGLLERNTALMMHLVTSTFSIACMSTMFGPLFLIPGFAAANTMGHAMNAGSSRGLRRVIIGIGTLAVLAPLGLEMIGLLPPSYVFQDGALIILPRMHGFPEIATTTFLVYVAVAHIAAASIMFGRVQDSLLNAERRLHMYTWQLKQLVPDEARTIPERLDEGR